MHRERRVGMKLRGRGWKTAYAHTHTQSQKHMHAQWIRVQTTGERGSSEKVYLKELL